MGCEVAALRKPLITTYSKH